MSSTNKMTGWMTALAMAVCAMGSTPAIAADGIWTADTLATDGTALNQAINLREVVAGNASELVMMGHDARIDREELASLVMMGYDARTASEDRPSLVLLGSDARESDDDSDSLVMLGWDARDSESEQPSLVLLGSDARNSDDTSTSLVMLGWDARQGASDCMVLLGSDALINNHGQSAGMMITASGTCEGHRAYVPANTLDNNDFVLVTTSIASTLTADVMDVLIEEGFNLAGIDSEAISRAAAGSSLSLEDAIQTSEAIAYGALSRFDNGNCGSDDLEGAICSALSN